MSADPASIHAELSDLGLTVAVAESLTGGLLSAALTQSPGSSATFRGGVVVYATDLKSQLAGVPKGLLDGQGPVSADVAEALAQGARQRLGADLGIGLTGVAGPESVGGHGPGTVFVAVVGPGRPEAQRAELTGSRSEIRTGAVTAALELLATVLATIGPPRNADGFESVTP